MRLPLAGEKLIALSLAQYFKSGNRERLVMITQERLKQVICYHPDTGVFVWNVSRGRVKRGDLCGNCSDHKGKKYRVIRIDGCLYFAHRLAWLYVHGQFPRDEIDHIDGNGINNKLNNIRSVTVHENRKNERLASTNTSGFCGVYWNRRDIVWRAQIKVNNKCLHLGSYKTIIDAVAARIRANQKHGFHANHGQKRPL